MRYAFDGLAGDWRFAIRSLRRRPVYATACILTLALGIGATTSVFAIVDATLIRPLPYRQPDRLVAVGVLSKGPDGSDTSYGPSQMEFVRWQAAARAFEAIEAAEPRTLALTGKGDPELVQAAAVSSGMFAMLGVQPVLGRTFSAEEERADAPCAVISARLSHRRFGAANPVGQVLTLDERAYDVVGVMPDGFAPLLIPSDVWVPLHATADTARLNNRVMAGAGRLRAGVTVAQAEQALAPISAGIGREFPASHGRMRPRVVPLSDALYGAQKRGLLALSAAVLMLLALAAVNVLNLTLGHLASRRSELAVRSAIGGTRWRLVRLQLVESTAVATAGGAMACAMMHALLPAILRLQRAAGQTPVEASLDWRVGVFGAGAIVITVVISGVYPAIRAHSETVGGGVVRAAQSRAGSGPWDRRLRAGLVVLQIALAAALLSAAGAFTVSLQRVLAAAPGFSPDSVLTAQLLLSPVRHADAEERARFVERVLARTASIPGVEAAGSTQTTFLPNQSMQTSMWVDRLPADADHVQAAHIRHITPGYFPALRVPVVEGRAIDARDRWGAPMVCMVSARLARQYWPGESAIGHRARRTGPSAQWMTIVGVAAEVMDSGLGVEPGPTLYVPYLQQNTPTARVSLVVRASGDPLAVARAVQQAVWAEDPAQPIDAVGRLDDLMIESAGDRRFQTMVLALFAGVGLALALVGVYGVAAAAVQSRTWEVGVRLALGARPAGIVLDMLRDAALRVTAGIAVGIAAFLSIGRAAAALLYATSFDDPRVLGAAVLPLAVFALAITLLQARRLARVQPVLALRNDT